MCKLRMLDHRSLLPFSGTACLLPGLLSSVKSSFVKRIARRVLASDINTRPEYRVRLFATIFGHFARFAAIADDPELAFFVDPITPKLKDTVSFRAFGIFPASIHRIFLCTILRQIESSHSG